MMIPSGARPGDELTITTNTGQELHAMIDANAFHMQMNISIHDKFRFSIIEGRLEKGETRIRKGGRSRVHVVLPSLVHAVFPSLVHVGRLHLNSMACCMHGKQFGMLYGLKKVSSMNPCNLMEEGEQHLGIRVYGSNKNMPAS